METINYAGSAPTADAIALEIEKERRRRYAEAGLDLDKRKHFKRPGERPFTKAERDTTTILYGGLTLRHERLIHAAFTSLGYRMSVIPTPRKADFQAGKEYGNNGQCNPTYFTVGALVNYLKDLRDRQGIATEAILRDYIFVTAGSCGPCRFGMYEAEYRLALRNSGFDGFRVILFQQQGGLKQAVGEEQGLEFNAAFALRLLNAIVMGDLLNEVAYQLRPYEAEPGQVNRAFDRALDHICDAFQTANDRIGAAPAWWKRLPKSLREKDGLRILQQRWEPFYVQTMAEACRIIAENVEVDFTRPRPVCKVTGEFWAQTTEGDGNFHMFEFLEAQGAEVLVETITTWINYLINQARGKIADQAGLEDPKGPFGALRGRLRNRWKLARIEIARRFLDREYERLRKALGGTAHRQVCQLELQRMGHPYYNSKAAGGEGHLEVAKNIYYANKSLAHMVMSLKPFGCMPSAQSDGAQAAVTTHFSDMIFIPIETSGEGDVNAHSRAQMALGEAKLKSKQEFQACVKRSGYTIDQIRAYVEAHPDFRKPFQKLPHYEGVVGRAANFVLYVGERMAEDRAWKVDREGAATRAVV
ncbi:MAG: activator of (R)-2-hydroxyglutaryl-CoA dehydratase [Candidatus Hydrogenedentes bacterium]|nr:activator of (R)-2-hydroxyglutaryl-CoA dehydratase [Candidatus Hydrogenedentota bacterium]